MLQLREWLTIDESCQFLSEKLAKPVNLDALYRLVLDGYLQLSLNLQSPVKARTVKIVQKPIKSIFSRLDIYLEENRDDFLRREAPASDEYDYAEQKEEKQFAIEGVHPLSMQGEERFLVECMYSRYINQPLPRRPTTRPSGIILDMGEGELIQLLTYLNARSEINSLLQEVEKGIFPERIATFVIPILENIQASKPISPDYWKCYKPRNDFPSDAYLVVRMSALESLLQVVESSDNRDKVPPADSVVKKNFERFLLQKCYGDEVLKNIRRFTDQKNSPIQQDCKRAGVQCPSGMSMKKWYGDM